MRVKARDKSTVLEEREPRRVANLKERCGSLPCALGVVGQHFSTCPPGGFRYGLLSYIHLDIIQST